MSFEKVNPSHPDKVADRIAGAIVDLAYQKQDNPKIAVEVLIGHYHRIAGKDINIDYQEVPQDEHLAENQSREIRCGDNGIFKGVPVNMEEATLRDVVKNLYKKFPTDGKFIYNSKTDRFIACQSNASQDALIEAISDNFYEEDRPTIYANPLGDWTGGTSVDTGATNRKLGSDMGRAVTGGGLHGKDLSKADVSVNIAGKYINKLGGFEKLAEWGLI